MEDEHNATRTPSQNIRRVRFFRKATKMRVPLLATYRKRLQPTCTKVKPHAPLHKLSFAHHVRKKVPLFDRTRPTPENLGTPMSRRQPKTPTCEVATSEVTTCKVSTCELAERVSKVPRKEQEHDRRNQRTLGMQELLRQGVCLGLVCRRHECRECRRDSVAGIRVDGVQANIGNEIQVVELPEQCRKGAQRPDGVLWAIEGRPRRTGTRTERLPTRKPNRPEKTQAFSVIGAQSKARKNPYDTGFSCKHRSSARETRERLTLSQKRIKYENQKRKDKHNK